MEDVMTEIVKNQIHFKKDLNVNVKKLIKKILILDPKRRPSTYEILQDDIFKNFHDKRETLLAMHKMDDKDSYTYDPI